MTDVTTGQAAAILGTTRSAVQKAIARGTLRARTVTGPKGHPAYLVSLDEIERYRAEHLTPRLTP